jgi:ABC-type branched-subunit amino acid transport system substrate-binding protein
MFENSATQAAGEADPFTPRLRLVVRDSAGSPVQAAAAVRELSEIKDVVALIGPLHHEAAEGAAEVAERLEIPLLTLTSREDVSRDRPHVFRCGMTQDSRTEALAGLVESELGLGRVAIMYPKDQYGKRLKNLFWDAIEAHGGEVVGVASYAPDATDFADGIRSLVGYTLLTRNEKALLEERRHLRDRSKRLPLDEAIALRSSMDVLTTMEGSPLPPIVDFDAVFIADSHEKVVLIAPQLAFHDVTDIRLLGAGGWNHPDLLSMGRKHVRGAIFAEAFYSEHPHPAVTHFVERYHTGYDGEVSQFSAQSYDATNLVLAQFARGKDTREDITRGLLRVREYAGASGSTSIQPDGNARKHPFLLEVRWGRILPLKTP